MRFYAPKARKMFWYKHHRLMLMKDVILNSLYSIIPGKYSYINANIQCNSIPVIINNFNRLDCLKILINWLRNLDDPVSIIILDNNSTYPPLLQFYKSLKNTNINLIMLKKNRGTKEILSLAKSLHTTDKFVITDPDLIPYHTTPKDILSKMKEVLDTYNKFNHVGASLEINDLPDYYPLKETVIEWESQFWESRLNNKLFIATVDTTFAMYRSGSNVRKTIPALRLDRPYTFKHIDWYIDPNFINQENRYYLSTCNNYATWSTRLKEEFSDFSNMFQVQV